MTREELPHLVMVTQRDDGDELRVISLRPQKLRMAMNAYIAIE